jgi:8-oxo-dGTP pyrophosphatase MutT (NUDIX family)
MKSLPRLVYRLRRLWWRIARPITVGVRILLVEEGRVLLVKHTYQHAWYMPGGGVKRGESLEQAVRREADEEVGACLGELQLLGAYSSSYEGKSDHVVVFACTSFSLGGETDAEIERFRFFPLDGLPAGISRGTRLRIEEYLRGDVPCFGLWRGPDR